MDLLAFAHFVLLSTQPIDVHKFEASNFSSVPGRESWRKSEEKQANALLT